MRGPSARRLGRLGASRGARRPRRPARAPAGSRPGRRPRHRRGRAGRRPRHRRGRADRRPRHRRGRAGAVRAICGAGVRGPGHRESAAGLVVSGWAPVPVRAALGNSEAGVRPVETTPGTGVGTRPSAGRRASLAGPRAPDRRQAIRGADAPQRGPTLRVVDPAGRGVTFAGPRASDQRRRLPGRYPAHQHRIAGRRPYPCRRGPAPPPAGHASRCGSCQASAPARRPGPPRCRSPSGVAPGRGSGSTPRDFPRPAARRSSANRNPFRRRPPARRPRPPPRPPGPAPPRPRPRARRGSGRTGNPPAERRDTASGACAGRPDRTVGTVTVGSAPVPGLATTCGVPWLPASSAARSAAAAAAAAALGRGGSLSAAASLWLSRSRWDSTPSRSTATRSATILALTRRRCRNSHSASASRNAPRVWEPVVGILQSARSTITSQPGVDGLPVLVQRCRAWRRAPSSARRARSAQ